MGNYATHIQSRNTQMYLMHSNPKLVSVKQYRKLVVMVGCKTLPHCARILGFNISGLNLAKTGHLTIKMRCLMPLTVVAWRDICLTMLQDRDYEAHISNTAKVSDNDMNLKQKTKQWNKAEADFMDSCIDAMRNGNMEQEARFDLQPEKFLVPSRKAWHKVPATFSKTNPTQKQKPMKRKLHQDSENDTLMMTMIL